MSKSIKQIITHFLDDDLYKFTMLFAVIVNFPTAIVRYAFVDRNNTVYPKGFAEELRRQIDALANLVISEQEIEFLSKKCYYLPKFFIQALLRGYRYDPSMVKVWQNEDGRLNIIFEGTWWRTILLEVKVLAITSELYYIMTNQDIAFNYEEYYNKTYKKAERLLQAGCVFSDFGTRRRSSFETQEVVIKALNDCYKSRNWEALTKGKFCGTSNTYFAMKYDLTPIGTMAHEFVCGIAGLNGGPILANIKAMEAWDNAFHGALGIYLYDTYGFDIFSKNITEAYANQFRGVRVDSGDNFEQLRKICKLYADKRIDSRTKQITFSNALNVDRAIQIQKVASKVCLPNFGIGGHFTNDWEGICPMNIVIKLVAIADNESWGFLADTCKLSEDKGKHTGVVDVVNRFMSQLPQFAEELKKQPKMAQSIIAAAQAV